MGVMILLGCVQPMSRLLVDVSNQDLELSVYGVSLSMSAHKFTLFSILKFDYYAKTTLKPLHLTSSNPSRSSRMNWGEGCEVIFSTLGDPSD